MYHIKADPREQKSASLLAEAARLQLFDEDTSPTIASLCRSAGVARSTFYRLFDEYDDVLRYALDLRFDTFVRDYADLIQNGRENCSPAQWYMMGFEKHLDELIALIRNGKVTLLIDAHIRALGHYADTLFPEMDPSSSEFHYFVYSRSYIALGVLQAWLKNGRKESPDTVRSIMEKQLRFLN